MGIGPDHRAPAAGLLERSAELSALREAFEAVVRSGRGRLITVAGEAGIGKTALVNAFCAGLGSARVLRGTCDALLTPRALGPMLDIAGDTGGPLVHALEQGGVGDVLVAFLGELGRRRGTVAVLEDLHWADAATLDLVRLVARRIGSVGAVVIAVYRDTELHRAHPLRLVLGDLPRDAVTRISLRPLSTAAVRELSGALDVDPDELHRRTGGNPFFVTEVLAAGGSGLPAGVRDAVLARAARLGRGPRAVLDAVSIAPTSTESWVLEDLVPAHFEHVEACVDSGMLTRMPGGVAFRHEIARTAIEDALSPAAALRLHRRALAMLTDGRRAVDPARLVHHAEGAGDSASVLVHAPAAGQLAAHRGAHREAGEQFARALQHGRGLEPVERAHLLDRRSYECYLAGDITEAIEARREALAAHRDAADRRRQGEDHRWLSLLSWFAGDRSRAQLELQRSLEILETLEPGRELGMAYSNRASAAMTASDLEGARRWGLRAIEIGERCGDSETVVHALNNVGVAELWSGRSTGADKLERSLALAAEAGLDEHVARAHANLACSWIELRDYRRAEAHLRQGLEFCDARGLDSFLLYMTGWQARAQLEQGDWDGATASADEVLSRIGAAQASRMPALVVRGRLRARRGDPDPWHALDEARTLARATGEFQRLLPVALARAEAHWLTGRGPGVASAIASETGEALELARMHRSRWAIGELLTWRRRAGIREPEGEGAPAEPFRLSLAGDHRAAADRWTEVNCPYEAALSLTEASDPTAIAEGLATLRRLGARAAEARAGADIRARGLPVARGPRPGTRANPPGLTARELEVLGLLADGMRNAQIADRLIVSTRTVDHHVSAILRKLGVSTRTEAVARARRQDLA